MLCNVIQKILLPKSCYIFSNDFNQKRTCYINAIQEYINYLVLTIQPIYHLQQNFINDLFWRKDSNMTIEYYNQLVKSNQTYSPENLINMLNMDKNHYFTQEELKDIITDEEICQLHENMCTVILNLIITGEKNLEEILPNNMNDDIIEYMNNTCNALEQYYNIIAREILCFFHQYDIINQLSQKNNALLITSNKQVDYYYRIWSYKINNQIKDLYIYYEFYKDVDKSHIMRVVNNFKTFQLNNTKKTTQENTNQFVVSRSKQQNNLLYMGSLGIGLGTLVCKKLNSNKNTKHIQHYKNK